MSLHSLSFRAFCQATEDEMKVRRALLFASGAKEGDVERTKCQGYHGNPIVILDVTISSARAIKAVFQRLTAEDRGSMLEDLERRVDDQCAFYFRLDKQKAFMGEMLMGEAQEGDDIIAVHGKVKSYPKSRDTALSAMRAYLETLG